MCSGLPAGRKLLSVKCGFGLFFCFFLREQGSYAVVDTEDTAQPDSGGKSEKHREEQERGAQHPRSAESVNHSHFSDRRGSGEEEPRGKYCRDIESRKPDYVVAFGNRGGKHGNAVERGGYRHGQQLPVARLRRFAPGETQKQPVYPSRGKTERDYRRNGKPR